MKTLLLVRHAKSSWDSPEQSDFERPLNKRGHRDAPFMGKIIKQLNILPELIVSSPAKRAITTATYYAEELGYPVQNIIQDEIIYANGPKEILKMINQIDDSLNCIMVFGHNPDLSTLFNYLSDNEYGSLPTCGTICIDFEIDSWSNVGETDGTMRFFEHPKKYFKKND